MKLNLDAIKREEKKEYSFNFQMNINDINYYGDVFKVIKPMDIVGKIYHIRETLFLNCSIEGSLQVNCGRCLKPFVYGFKTTVSAELIEEKNLSKDDDYLSEDILTYKDDEIDFEEIVREQVTANVPMKLVCSQTCKGLCNKCGKDLNEEECECDLKISDDEIDPRLAKLKDLLQQD